MGSDRYLLKRFGLLGFLFGGKSGEEPPDSQSAVGQPPAVQPVREQNLVEAIRKLPTETLQAALEAAGHPAIRLSLWQELTSLLTRDVSVTEAIKAARVGKYDEMCNHLEELISKLQRLASHSEANPGLQKVIETIMSEINELIGKTPKATGGTPS
jgi:hypothetical protein